MRPLSSTLISTFLLAAALLLQQLPAYSAETTLQGQLLERGTKKPLADVNVFVLPAKLKAVTDGHGNFTVEHIPEGEFQWVVNLTGYEKLEKTDDVSSKLGTSPRQLYLQKSSYEVYETTVYGKVQKRDDSTRSLKASVAVALPGSGNDPIRAVQNLPGVNRPAAFQSQVIIQGSAPQDTRYLIDGHEVPLIFHFGGLSSVILPEALDRVDYLAAGFDPDSGRAIGGLIGVWTRPPQKDRLHGFAFVDIFNSGAAIEGPVGKDSSFLLGVRKSYVGEVLKAALKNNEDFNLTAAPSFSDVTGVYDTRLTERDEFRLVTDGSIDTLEFLLKQPVNQDPALRGTFYNKTAFFRVIPELTHRNSERTTTRYSLGFGRDWIKVLLSDDYFLLRTYALTSRAELETAVNPSWTTYLGMDNRSSWNEVDLNLPVFYNPGGVANPISSGTKQLLSVRETRHQLGFYSKNQVVLTPKWSVFPGVRLDYYSATKETLPQPRFSVRYALSDSLNFKAKGGLYHQPPREQESAVKVGNPDIRSPRAWHATFGAQKDFREGSSRGFNLESGTFYRYFDRLVVPSSALVTRDGILAPENYNNQGKGRAFGLESILRYDFSPWTGWISYTLSRSTRWQPFQPESLSQYDQTHNLNLLGSVDLPRNWKIAGRLRFVTGNPSTPISDGVYDADNDVYIPVRGVYFSERLAPFYQLDIRVDKKWIHDRWILSMYLDIQNVTNRKNVEAVQYSYDYRARANVASLPILPTLGIKGEF
ncbi:MAG: TonB-dependent receptor [Methylotenera sp.]|nr:TonB-dependent receptor [Oligoflexia bacterium]